MEEGSVEGRRASRDATAFGGRDDLCSTAEQSDLWLARTTPTERPIWVAHLVCQTRPTTDVRFVHLYVTRQGYVVLERISTHYREILSILEMVDDDGPSGT